MDDVKDETINLIKSINNKDAINYIYLIVREIAKEQQADN